MLTRVLDAFRLLSRRKKISFSAILLGRVLLHILDVLGLLALGLLAAMFAGNIAGNDEPSFFGIETPPGSEENFLLLFGAISVLFLLKSSFGAILLRTTSRFLAKAESAAAVEIANYVFFKDFDYVVLQSRAGLQWALNTSTHVAFSVLLYSGATLVTEGALFLTLFVLFALIDPITAILVSAYFTLFVASFQVLITGRLRRLGERIADNAINLGDTVLSLISGYAELSVLERRELFLRRYEQVRYRFGLDHGLERFVMAVPRYFVEAALIVGVLGMMLVLLASGQLSEGLISIAVFLTGGLRIMAAVLPVQTALSDLRVRGAQADQAIELLQLARSEALPEKRLHRALRESNRVPTHAGAEPSAISAVAVSYSASSSKRHIIKNLDLVCRPGSVTAIVGPSGSGKTTVARLIVGLLSADEGTLEVDGKPPQELRVEKPGAISFVPQQPATIGGSLAQNVALENDDDSIDFDFVEYCLSQSALLEFGKTLPNGIHTRVGSGGIVLSGGETQRLGIARALYSRPTLLVLDEATSALDAGTEDHVARAMIGMRQETTVVMIAHRISSIQNCDNIVFLAGGMKTGEGDFQQLCATNSEFRRYTELMRLKNLG